MEKKQVVRQIIESVWNKGDAKFAGENIAPNAITHDPMIPNAAPGAAALLEQMRLYRSAFPDLRMTIDDQFADGETVVTRWTARGTHNAALLGVAPTHRKVTVTGIQIDRFENGKVIESWVNWDSMGLMQQIGMLPPLGISTGSAASRGTGLHK